MKTSFIREAEAHLCNEVHYIIYELDYRISKIESTTLSRETYLAQTEDNYILFNRKDITLNCRL